MFALFNFPKPRAALQSSLFVNSGHSFRTRISLVFGLSILLLSGLLSLVVGQTTETQAELQVGRDLADLAHQMADKLDRGMFERYRDIQIVSSATILGGEVAGSPIQNKRVILEKLQNTYPDYAWIGYVGLDGRVLVSTGRLLEGEDVSARPWYKAGLRGPYVGDVHEAVLLAKLLPPLANYPDEPRRFVDVAAPVVDQQGRQLGVLGAHLSWEWARNVERSLLDPVANARQLDFFIFSSDKTATRTVLLGPASFLNLRDEQISPVLKLIERIHSTDHKFLVANWPDNSVENYLTGVARTQGYLTYPGLNWTVVVRQRTGVAFEAARSLQIQILFYGLGFGLLFAALGWFVAGRIANPLLQIAQVADRIRQGDRQVEIPARRVKDEVYILSLSLGSLVGTLTSQEQELLKVNQQLDRRVGQLQHREAQLVSEITERNRAEHERQQQVLDYRLLLDQAADAIFICNRQGKLITVNSTACEMSGYSQDELLNLNIRALVYEETTVREPLRLTELRIGRTLLMERKMCLKDGTLLPVEVSARLLKDGRLQAIVRDVSERKRLEEALHNSESQLLHAQKMEAIGRLAGGVAHDFNNLLTVIQGTTELMLYTIPGKVTEQVFSQLHEGFDQIIQASERGSALTRQLLVFSRQQVLSPQVLEINEVVQQSCKLINRLIGADIEVNLHLAPDAGQVQADAGHLGQVIMNLAVNARDAMPNGGKLIIETASVELDEGYSQHHMNITPGAYVLLSVSDTGCGMDKETLSRIFEPFFTTKESGKGTGLGLATVYGIINQSQGHIWVYSELERGTTFKIYLPLVRDKNNLVPAPLPPLPGIQSGSESVLLVEDEESVRWLVRKVLELNGYRVLEAASSVEALKYLEEPGLNLDILITDIVLPYMSGAELSQKLKGPYPRLRVLFMSGYTDYVATQNGLLQGDMNFIPKPFTPTELTRRVRAVLDQPDPVAS